MADSIDDGMRNKQIRFLSRAESYIKENNKKGYEREIVEFGHRIENYDLITQKEYINILCNSDYPITAAMTVKSLHHDGVIKLEELIQNNMESLQWTLFQKIITLIYLNNYKEITGILDKTDDIQILDINIRESLRFLVNENEHRYIFQLFYAVANSKYRSDLFYHFSNIRTYEFYIEQSYEIIQEAIQIVYEKKDYDSLFYLCKNFNLLQSLKDILQRSTEELEREFLSLNTINGVRLAFRVLQNEILDDEKAYKLIISKITNMDRSDDIQYIYFCYLLKLIQIQSNLSEDVKEKLQNIGEIKLLKGKIYGIDLLAECLETVITNKGMEAYNEFIDLLGVNNIFTYKEEVPQISPYLIYKKVKPESISMRRKSLKEIRHEMKFNDLDFFDFYMNSFYKYLLTINDFFSILYEKSEDRVYLKRILSKYVFYGKISFVNKERGVVGGHYQNVVSELITLNEKNIGKIYFDLLKEEDEFAFKLMRFNPKNKLIGITDFQFIEEDRNIKYENTTQLHWKTLKDCFNNIIIKAESTSQDQENIKSVPPIRFKENNIVDEYTELYSKVLIALKHNSEEIIKFIKTLDEYKNNLFSIDDNNSSFLPISRTDRSLVKRGYETIECLIKTDIRKKDLIWIYLNSYLRLVIDIQVILKSIMSSGEDTLRLDSIFSGYRFFGELVKTDKKEKDIEYANSISMNTSEYMQFSIDKEQSVTRDMIEENKMITFRLKEYHRNSGYIEIEGISVQAKDKWVSKWGVIHDCHSQMKFLGTPKKEILEELRKLPSLETNEIDFNKLIQGFIWSMNNLCNYEDILFNYIEALYKNNPYKYIPGKSKKSFLIDSEECNREQSKVILNHIIKNRYNLNKTTQIYLNSYLSNHIPFDYMLKEFYKGDKSNKKDKVQYLTGISRIEFVASIEEISKEKIFLKFTQIDSNSKLFIRLEDTDYDETNFNIGQRVNIVLVEYHEVENMIGAELW